jgi:hypothetical protein
VPRWLWWAPFAFLLVGCGLISLRIGWIVATLTETDVITQYAQRYVKAQGNSATFGDCAAMPANVGPKLWIVVRYITEGAQIGQRYLVNRFGGLVNDVSVGLSTRPNA